MSEVRTPIDNRQTTEGHITTYVTTNAAIVRVLLEEFVAYVENQGDWIDERVTIDKSTNGSSVIALAEINGARAMTQRILDYLNEMS